MARTSLPLISSFFYRVNIVNAEGQHISVIDRVHDSIGMKLVPEGLRSCQQFQMFPPHNIFGEDRRASEAEQVIIFKHLDNFGVHIPKLAAVTLVKNNDTVLSIYGVASFFRDKDI